MQNVSSRFGNLLIAALVAGCAPQPSIEKLYQDPGAGTGSLVLVRPPGVAR